jgi:hypothetical protein
MRAPIRGGAPPPPKRSGPARSGKSGQAQFKENYKQQIYSRRGIPAQATAESRLTSAISYLDAATMRSAQCERQLRGWQRLESALCRCGAPRLIFELLKELIRHGLIEEAEIDRRLDSFTRLDSSSFQSWTPTTCRLFCLIGSDDGRTKRHDGSGVSRPVVAAAAGNELRRLEASGEGKFAWLRDS